MIFGLGFNDIPNESRDIVLDYKDSAWSSFRIDVCKRYFEVLNFKKPETDDLKGFNTTEQVVLNMYKFLNSIVRSSDARVVNMLANDFDNIIFWIMVAGQKRLVLEITRIIGEEKNMSKMLLDKRLNARFKIVSNDIVNRSLKVLKEIGIVNSKRGLSLNKELLDADRHKKVLKTVRFLDFRDTDVLSQLIVGGI